MGIKMKISVIGCGNLGGSFTKGLIESETFNPDEIIVSDPDTEKLKEFKELGVKTTTDNKEASEKSDKIFIAVKPSLVGEVLEELELSSNELVVSLAAGVSTTFLEVHTDAKIIRIMPNICGSVSEMASAYTLGSRAGTEDEKFVKNILENLGETCKVKEPLMDTVTGLSGSGPAYVFLVIAALKEAGTELGLSEDEALKLASQTIKGGGELVLRSDKDLEELIDMVCSPKGTTIEGVKVIQDEQVQEALKEAVRAAKERSEELSR